MSNQEKLRNLLIKGGVTQAEAAVLIAEETKRPCSVRSVRAWLADVGLSSSRTCPDWALQALESRLKFHKKLLD